MKTFAKVLIMLIRFVALVSIALGVLIWGATRVEFVGAHIGLGFAITLLIALLAVLALVRRQIGAGIGGLVVAVLLPYVGLKQFPLAFMPHFGGMQVAHLITVVAALGIAEMLYARIAKS